MCDSTILPGEHPLITESQTFLIERVTGDPVYESRIALIPILLSGPQSFHPSQHLPSFGGTKERTRLVSVSMKACQTHKRDNSSLGIQNNSCNFSFPSQNTYMASEYLYLLHFRVVSGQLPFLDQSTKAKVEVLEPSSSTREMKPQLPPTQVTNEIS